MVEGLSHFAFTVSDIEASVHWYGTVLGLRLVARQRQDNEYTRKMVGLGYAVLEGAEFELDPGHAGLTLELLQYVSPLGERPSLPRLTWARRTSGSSSRISTPSTGGWSATM